MHWRTFEQLTAEHDAFVSESLAGMLQRIRAMKESIRGLDLICSAKAGIIKTVVYVETDLSENTTFLLPVPSSRRRVPMKIAGTRAGT